MSQRHTTSVMLPPHEGEGLLGLPAGAKGIVLFAHGSFSSRLSPRNTMVADVLQQAGLATLLFDLLTEQEAAQRDSVFDIPLLADRLNLAAAWVGAFPATRGLPIGLFGASTGGAAALVAAAMRRDVQAVVSRGGRPDLAGDALSKVRAPTLLIVGGADPAVLDLNQQAMRRMPCHCRLEIIPDATHLFEEPGALEVVAGSARDWFHKYLVEAGSGQ
jgi:putative phosphoribosyl transferase